MHSSEIPMVQRRGGKIEQSGRNIFSKGRGKFHSQAREIQLLIGSVLTTLVISLLILYKFDILSSSKWNLSEDVKIVDSHLTRRRLMDELVEDMNRPYVIVFYSETCIGCKRIKKPFYQIAHQLDDINFYAVPVTMKDNKDLVSEFQLSFVPSVYVVTKASGDVQRILYDGKPLYDPLKSFIDKHITNISNSHPEDEEKSNTQKMDTAEKWA